MGILRVAAGRTAKRRVWGKYSMGLLRAGDIRSIRMGVRGPGVPGIQVQQRSGLWERGRDGCYVETSVPLDAQDLRSRWTTSSPSQVVRDPREVLVVNDDLLNDASFHTCPQARVVNEAQTNCVGHTRTYVSPPTT